MLNEVSLILEEPARSLSPRELAVLCKLTNIVSGKEIANTLGITEAAVHAHVRILLKKIGVQNRTQAAIWATKHGIGEAETREIEPAFEGVS
jgi:two-component system nitrate/nitrite response regulator NarL